MSTDIETVVIGAGVVGLAIARALSLAGQETLVIEQHRSSGLETSTRNSQVVHAGLYYPPGSSKARLCRRGNELLTSFARTHDIGLARCGKLLVAATDEEVPQLEALAENAKANGVSDLQWLTANQARLLESELSCAAAVLSPSSGTLDAAAYVTALEADIASAGGSIAFETGVIRVKRKADDNFVIDTMSNDDVQWRITARNVVAAAGLYATQFGQDLPRQPGYEPPHTYAAKGHYFALRGAAPFTHLIYPLPSRHALGIHATVRDGQTLFGPDIEWVDKASYDFADSDGARAAAFAVAIRRYWPALPDGALVPAFAGLRPKLSRASEPARDFAIHTEAEHGIQRLVALYGIESPGLTASLAIGERVARHLMK